MKIILIAFLITIILTKPFAQEKTNDGKLVKNAIANEDNFIYPEYKLWVDSSSSVSLQDILERKNGITFYNIPHSSKIVKPGYVYWIDVDIENKTNQSLIMEFIFLYNVTIYWQQNNIWLQKKYDISTNWFKKDYFNNSQSFALPINKNSQKYYLRIEADYAAGLGFIVYTLKSFNIHYVTSHAFQIIFSITVFLILIFNLLLFIQLREKIYVYYNFYLISILLFSSVFWGWIFPMFSINHINFFWYNIPFGFVNIFLIAYSIEYLQLKDRSYKLYKILNGIIVFRFVLIITSLIRPDFIVIKFLIENISIIDVLVLLPVFYASIQIQKQGFKPAKFIIISYSIIILGFLINAIYLEYIFPYLNIWQKQIYSETGNGLFLFLWIEILVFTYSLSARYRTLKDEKEAEHLLVIASRDNALKIEQENLKLKDELNSKLEKLVALRTEELENANEILEQQAKEIAAMNDVLKEDNEKLVYDLEQLKNAQVLAKGLSFEEFKKTFDSESSSLKFIAGLKWHNGYKCKKCGFKKSYLLDDETTRKCKVCFYVESATVDTLLDNLKFSPQKALYIVYSCFTNPHFNSKQVSEELELRYGTCLNFQKKVKENILTHKSIKGEKESWVEIVYQPQKK